MLTVFAICALLLAQVGSSWEDVFDGKTLTGWTAVGSARWSVLEGTLTANPSVEPPVAGPDGKPAAPSGFLVTDATYGNFDLTAEFWSEANTNSGIFVRCTAAQPIGQKTCYEVNISDDNATFPTGSIVGMYSTLPVRVTTAARWSRLEIAAHGTSLAVRVDGRTVVDVNDGKFVSGAIALQAGGPNGPGLIRFRNIRIRQP